MMVEASVTTGMLPTMVITMIMVVSAALTHSQDSAAVQPGATKFQEFHKIGEATLQIEVGEGNARSLALNDVV